MNGAFWFAAGFFTAIALVGVWSLCAIAAVSEHDAEVIDLREQIRTSNTDPAQPGDRSTR